MSIFNYVFHAHEKNFFSQDTPTLEGFDSNMLVQVGLDESVATELVRSMFVPCSPLTSSCLRTFAACLHGVALSRKSASKKKTSESFTMQINPISTVVVKIYIDLA